MSHELDTKVAEAMGWQIANISIQSHDAIWVWADAEMHPWLPVHLWKPSTDWWCAGQVVEYVRMQAYAGRTAFIDAMMDLYAEQAHWFPPESPWQNPFHWLLIQADVPEAICLAFLRAMGIEWDNTDDNHPDTE